jgi:hypothetical protein
MRATRLGEKVSKMKTKGGSSNMNHRLAVLSALIPLAAILAASSPAAAEDAPPRKSSAELSLRDDLDYMLKPGSGWIIGGIPLVVEGVASIAMGIALVPNGDMLAGILLLSFASSGVVLIATGGAFIGYGVSRNNKYIDGRIDYVSPSTGYIATGATNIVVGLGLEIPLLVLSSEQSMKEPLTVTGLTLGAFNVAYGLGFLLYGALYDFEKQAGEKTRLHKTASSIRPYFGCTGGMCDGHTSRATGREAYVGGIRGEF